MRTLRWIGCLLAASVTVAPTARAANPDERVLVLPLEVEGSIQDKERDQLETALREGLRRGALSPIPQAEVEAHLRRSGSCSDNRCVRKVVDAVEASVAVRSKVIVRDRVYSIEIEVVAGVDLSTRARATDECEICGIQEVVDRMGDQAAIVAAKISDVASQPALRVESSPSGARVSVDEELVGTTPMRHDISRGPHVVRLEKDGYITQERKIDGTPGVEEHVEMNLQPLPVDKAAAKRGRPMIVAGASGVGVGLAIVGVGIPLVLIDGRENSRKCDGDDVDVNGTCRWTYSTLSGGAAALAVGGALTVAGAVVLVLGVRKKSSASTPQARIAPALGGLRLHF